MAVESSSRISFRIPAGVHSQIQKLAAARGVSQYQLFLDALNDALEGRGSVEAQKQRSGDIDVDDGRSLGDVRARARKASGPLRG